MSGGNEPRSRFHSFCTRLMNLPALRGVSVREAEKRKKQKLLLLHAAHKLASTLRRFSSWGYTYTQTKTHTHTQTYRHRHRHTDTDTDTHTHTHTYTSAKSQKSVPYIYDKKVTTQTFFENVETVAVSSPSSLLQYIIYFFNFFVFLYCECGDRSGVHPKSSLILKHLHTFQSPVYNLFF